MNRPPLAADKRKTTASAVAAATVGTGTSVPSVQPPNTSSVIPPVQPATTESWATVVRKGKKKSASPTAPTAVTPSTTILAQKRLQSALAVPRSPAVILKLQPEAEKKGVTYADAMIRAEQAVNLQEIGIKEGLKVRRSVTGARVLQLPKSQTMEVADQLAANLRTALAGHISLFARSNVLTFG